MPYHETVKTAAKKAGTGAAGALGLGGAADVAENGRFDNLGNVVAEVARRGGDVLGAVGDLVNRVTPDFISDIIPQGAGEAAGQAAGVIAPYSADALAVLGVVV